MLRQDAAARWDAAVWDRSLLGHVLRVRAVQPGCCPPGEHAADMLLEELRMCCGLPCYIQPPGSHAEAAPVQTAASKGRNLPDWTGSPCSLCACMCLMAMQVQHAHPAGQQHRMVGSKANAHAEACQAPSYAPTQADMVPTMPMDGSGSAHSTPAPTRCTR